MSDTMSPTDISPPPAPFREDPTIPEVDAERCVDSYRFAEFLKSLMIHYEWTQKDLSERVGLNTAKINHLLHERIKPNDRIIAQVARHLSRSLGIQLDPSTLIALCGRTVSNPDAREIQNMARKLARRILFPEPSLQKQRLERLFSPC